MRKRKSNYRQGIIRCHSLIDYMNKRFKLTKVGMSIPVLMQVIQTEDANEWSEPISIEDYRAMLAKDQF